MSCPIIQNKNNRNAAFIYTYNFFILYSFVSFDYTHGLLPYIKLYVLMTRKRHSIIVLQSHAFLIFFLSSKYNLKSTYMYKLFNV